MYLKLCRRTGLLQCSGTGAAHVRTYETGFVGMLNPPTLLWIGRTQPILPRRIEIESRRLARTDNLGSVESRRLARVGILDS